MRTPCLAWDKYLVKMRLCRLAKTAAKGHVNNVLYNRYAETGRIEWVQKYSRYIDPENARAWDELMSPKGDGLILRKISTEFKFVSDTVQSPFLLCEVADDMVAHEIPRPYQRLS
jgi:hypothetical protein